MTEIIHRQLGDGMTIIGPPEHISMIIEGDGENKKRAPDLDSVGMRGKGSRDLCTRTRR